MKSLSLRRLVSSDTRSLYKEGEERDATHTQDALLLTCQRSLGTLLIFFSNRQQSHAYLLKQQLYFAIASSPAPIDEKARVKMAFMLPIIKNDHPLLDPKVRRPSVSSRDGSGSSSRKASFTFGENRNKKHLLEGRQKSKSVSNEPSMMTTRIELQVRKRSHTANEQPSPSASAQSPKVGGVNNKLDTPNKPASYSLQNRNCPSGSPCERKAQVQSKLWTQSVNSNQLPKKTSDIR